MRYRVPVPALSAILALSIASGLFAQAPQPNAPARPTVTNLKEEQDKIGKAYLSDAEFQMKLSRERLGTGNNRLAQQAGLWALEQLAYAKRRLDTHASKIQEVAGLFTERATEATRKQLYDSYTKLRENHANLEDRLDAVAESLRKAGMPILADTLNNVRSSSGDAAIQAVQRGLQQAGEKGKGGLSDDTTPPPPPATSMQQTQPMGIPGATPPGTVSADGHYVDSPEFGRIDLSTGTRRADGSVAYRTADGRTIVRGADGVWRLEGAMGNGGGGASGKGGGNANFSGRLPAGTVVVDQNGNRITIDADFQNGEQTGVKKDYIGGAGATLVSETKVVRKLVQATGSEWKVNVANGESRSWNFSIRMGDQKSANGAVTLTLTVDGGGSTGFTTRQWEITDDKGNRAAVTPSSSNPAEAVATFTKGGEYTFSVAGETDWGSSFRVKGQGGVYP